MEIGLGLPAAVPGITAARLLEWARRAERAGFSTLGAVDRLVYPNLEPLTALAAAAAVTERIGLTTAILIAPYRNTALLAKQAASLDRLSEGRLTLGLAIGAREDDYQASGATFGDRGRRFDGQLEELRRIWTGEPRGHAGPIGPPPIRPSGPPLVIGGRADAAIERVVRHGDGWISGGGGAAQFAPFAQRVRDAWDQAGREGAPRLLALAYFALGDGARVLADAYIQDYYGFAGERAAQIASAVAVDVRSVRATAQRYAAAGCDELIWFPCSTRPDQVELLARAVL